MSFIRLNRKFFDHPFWSDDRTFSLAEAWLDLIASARFEVAPEREVVKMKIITINRGELRASQRYLAARWKWSVGKVNRFINLLVNERMIERRCEHFETIIKLCNYDTYNPSINVAVNTNEYTNGTPTEHQRIQTKEYKKVKNIDNINILSASEKISNAACSDNTDFFLTKRKRKLSGKRLETFLTFWTKFDYKKGKTEAADAWLDIPQLTNDICEKIYSAAEIEAKRRPHLESVGKTPKMAQGWLNGRRWEDEIYKTESNEINRESYGRKSAFPENNEAMQGIISRIKGTQ